MIRHRRRLVIAVAALATFAFAGAVLAAPDDDTVVNFGYDEDSQFFMWNVTSLDYEPWLEAIAEDPTAEADIDTLLASCGLEAEEGMEPVEFGYTFDGETISLFELDANGEFDPDGEPFDTGDCGGFMGDFVTGPAGQVNHGMFLKTFNALYDGPHRGCIVRRLAQSHFGKGDQQVKPDDESEEVVTAEEPEVIDIEGTVVFDTVTTSCGKKQKDDLDGDEAKGGPPAHVLEKFDGNHPKDKDKGKPAGTPGGRP